MSSRSTAKRPTSRASRTGPAATRPAPETGPAEGAATRASGMTVDELARAAGTTVRNLRAYQDRGLLPPPEIVGRTGYYDEGHLARLQLIARLLDQRFSLAAIGALLEAWEAGAGLGDVLGFEEALTRPFYDDPPVVLTAEEFEQRYGPGTDQWFDGVARTGVVSRLPAGDTTPGDDGGRGDRVVIQSPKLLDAGSTLVANGVPLEAVLEEMRQLRADAERIALRFNNLFATYVWRPFEAAGRPAADLHKVSEFLTASRPLPAVTTAAMVAQVMREQLESAIPAFLDPTSRSDGEPIA